MVLIESTAYLPRSPGAGTPLPPVSYVLEAHEHFQKGSWRNRCEDCRS
jgi:hypothetical protein